MSLVLVPMLHSMPHCHAQTLEWMRQLGTSENEFNFSKGVSADGQGNVYLSGSTEGSLGGTNAGNEDVFIAKYKADGSLEWTRQLGTSARDINEAVSADGLGNIYLSGWTSGSLGGANAGGVDSFVAKYDSAGTLLWTRQLGTNLEDYSFDVSADGLGNVYLTGTTDGSLGGASHGFRDAFVAKYDGAGNQLWTRQLGSDSNDEGGGVSADSLGNVYLSGETSGALGGPINGGFDSFLAKYDAAGNLRWARQFGPGQNDRSEGVSADGLGSVFFSGTTNGNFGGPNAGGLDVYVAKFRDPIPEPQAALLISVALLATHSVSRQKRARRCANAALHALR